MRISLAKANVAQAVLYPNPASSEIKLDMTMLPAGQYAIRIIGMDGRVIQEKTLSKETVQLLDVRWLSTGSYLIQLQGQGHVQTIQLLKR